MVNFNHINALIPKNRFLSRLEVLDLVASRADFAGVWKVQIPARYVPSTPAEVLGYREWRRRDADLEATEPMLMLHELQTWEQDLILWLTNTLKGRFLIGAFGVFYFENPKEAVLFKLTWG